jgi:hypothetical protein
MQWSRELDNTASVTWPHVHVHKQVPLGAAAAGQDLEFSQYSQCLLEEAGRLELKGGLEAAAILLHLEPCNKAVRKHTMST